jgi:hypothetical protein
MASASPAMEIARANTARTGASAATLIKTILKAMFRNALIVGIALGFIVNLSGILLPIPLTDTLDLVVRTALPVALFGVGGILVRYRPEGDLKVIAYVCAITLIALPAMVWSLGTAVDLPQAAFRSAVLTAAMAPGINLYFRQYVWRGAPRRCQLGFDRHHTLGLDGVDLARHPALKPAQKIARYKRKSRWPLSTR